jgi:hypothetical protein
LSAHPIVPKRTTFIHLSRNFEKAIGGWVH